MLGGIKQIFDIFASAPRDAFARRLKRVFGRTTAQEVLQVWDKLALPLPLEGEFVKGSEGPLILLTQLGLVIRMDPAATKGRTLGFRWDKINDSPFMLQPIGSITAGKAVIEICQGVSQTADKQVEHALHQHLKEQGLRFWDGGLTNVGILPVTTPDFPAGIPVVIDRMAVQKLSDAVITASKVVQMAREAEEDFYAPLRQSFLQAWPKGAKNPDPLKMRAFWDLCHSYKCAGKLVAGWEGVEGQNATAKSAAEKYKKHFNPIELS